MSEAPKSLEELCVERGMRMTEQRRIIARILEESADHPDVEELYRRCVAVVRSCAPRATSRACSPCRA